MAKKCTLPHSSELVCYTDPDGVKVTLTRTMLLCSTSGQPAYLYSDDNGQVVDTSLGTVVLGKCEITGPCEGDSLPIWTLLSKLGTPHPQAGTFGSTFTAIGSIPSGSSSTHPDGSTGSINGWNVYAMCSATQPADDSNGHQWIAGAPDGFSTYTFNRVSPDPACAAEEEVPLVKECNSKAILEAIENQTVLVEGCVDDGNGGVIEVVKGLSSKDGSIKWEKTAADLGFIS